ncbi:uncharacterized protein [Haliotis asinina]|uniref:uncharacterized protein isoform X2 n=1 Tax=Haliotis asinina TaxID=109174 RepID=UPI0035323E69
MGQLLVLATLVLLNIVACQAVDNSVCGTLSTGLFNICQVNTVEGKCVGDIDNGELCQCPESRAGPLCHIKVVGPKKNLSLCERQQELHTTTFRVLNTTDITDNSIVRFRILVNLDLLKSVMHAINISYLHERTCLPDGSFSSAQCDVNIDDLVTRRCYCVNSTTGDVVREVNATALANVRCEGERLGFHS